MSRDIDSGYHTCLVKLRKKGCTYTVWWYYATFFNPNTINQLILKYKTQKVHTKTPSILVVVSLLVLHFRILLTAVISY